MDFKNLSVCIPAYNEAGVIGKTLRELREAIPEAEIIVVDDGSGDDTAAVAKSLPGIIVLSHNRNMGYGAAIKTAIRHASRGVVAWYDGDGQHSPTDLKKVAWPVLNGEKDVVIGVRDKSSDQVMVRMPGKLLLTAIAVLVAREPVPDLNSGLRCFRKEVINKYLHLLPDGFSASTTTTLLMMKRGYLIGYQPISTQRRFGKSTVKIFRDGWRTLQLIMRILILFEAFNFFTILAMLQVIPGTIYGVTKSFTQGLGFPTLASTVVISGVLTFFMGIICDQIVALRQEKFENLSRDSLKKSE